MPVVQRKIIFFFIGSCFLLSIPAGFIAITLSPLSDREKIFLTLPILTISIIATIVYYKIYWKTFYDPYYILMKTAKEICPESNTFVTEEYKVATLLRLLYLLTSQDRKKLLNDTYINAQKLFKEQIETHNIEEQFKANVNKNTEDGIHL